MKFDIRIVAAPAKPISEEKLLRLMNYAVRHMEMVYPDLNLRIQKCKFQKTLRRKQTRKEN